MKPSPDKDKENAANSTLPMLDYSQSGWICMYKMSLVLLVVYSDIHLLCIFKPFLNFSEYVNQLHAGLIAVTMGSILQIVTA